MRRTRAFVGYGFTSVLALATVHCESSVDPQLESQEQVSSTSEALSPATGLTSVWRTDFTSVSRIGSTPSGSYDWVFEQLSPNGEVEQYTTNVCGANTNPLGTNWNYCVQSGQAGTTDGYALQIRAQNDGGQMHSGRINSKRMHEFAPSANRGIQYEASIRYDVNSINQGSWPAFWMLQRNINEPPKIGDGDDAPWPCWGAQEVDIGEQGSIGGSWNNWYNQSSLHSSSGGCSPQSPNYNPSVHNNWSKQLDDGSYHKYTMEFECGSSCGASSTMRFFVDGVQQGGDINTTGQGFDSIGSFFILNYAVGGGLGGTVNWGAFNNPGRSMYIDYVNVATYNPSSRGGGGGPCGPYSGTALAIPATIQAENYDTCGAGQSFNETTAGNGGTAYRSDDVDIEATTDTGGGYDVGWVNAGEWLKYSTTVATAGTFNAQVRVAAPAAGSTMHINVDGANVTGSLAIPNTGGWQNWTTVTSPNFSLSAGAHSVQAVFDTGNHNFNSMTFSSVVTSCGPYGGTAAAIPGTIQSENYGTCGAGQSFSDTTAGNTGAQYRSDDVDIEATTDTGGGYNVGWLAAGEWLNYSANVASAGTYNVQVRVASTSTGTMHVNVDGANVTGAIALPNSGGWQAWATVTSANFSLSAGAHQVRAVFDSGTNNINSMTFATASSCTPTSCSAQGKNCGSISDGCGGTLNCGSCTSPQTCGGGGTANVCGGGSCTPTTCAAQGKNCGSISDGCGGTLSCGSCTSPQTCGGAGTANVCGCTATTCAAQGKNCGSISNGCGGTLNCGSCTSPQTCGGGGTANVCGGGSGPACAAAYAQSNCLNYQQGTVVSSGGHNWTCANGNCMNCSGYASCAPGGSGCPWGTVWTDGGACQ